MYNKSKTVFFFIGQEPIGLHTIGRPFITLPPEGHWVSFLQNISEERVLLVCQIVESDLIAEHLVKLHVFTRFVLTPEHNV